MGQKRTKEKSPDEVQTERVTSALEETSRTGRVPTFVRENPGQFLRDMYEVWHRQGGKEGAHWRNSIRKMRDEWLVGRNAVPSLHPKLMGRVKVTKKDARALIDLFLGRWRRAEGDDPVSLISKDGYVGFAASKSLNLRNKMLASLLSSTGSDPQSTILLPEQPSSQGSHGADLRVQGFIEGEYSQCDALITFSRARIAVGPNPPEIMKAFLQFFHELYQEDKKQPDKKRIFIWVIDFGQRLLELDHSFREYYNAGFLSLLLQAFAKFDTDKDVRIERHGRLSRQLRIMDADERAKRWAWLSQRSVIVAENLRLEEIHELYPDEAGQLAKIRLRDSHVTQQHILPQEPPPNWIRDLRGLVGKEVTMANISTTVLLKRDGWRNKEPRSSDLKYYAHARILNSPDANFATATVNSVELSPAGPDYDEAYRILYLAALFRLNDSRDFDSDEATALAYLRKLDFHVLRIPDFIRLYSLGLISLPDAMPEGHTATEP